MGAELDQHDRLSQRPRHHLRRQAIRRVLQRRRPHRHRDASSGNGNLVVNHHDTKAKTWSQMYANLISGEHARNAYWQACVDGRGSIHISWVWRESGDVATNHDLCYARSDDGGKIWKKSDGSDYALPITASTAEIALGIPQKHELINQTSMCTDDEGHPMIATYFRPEGQPVP